MNMKIRIEKISVDGIGFAENVEIEIPGSTSSIEKVLKTTKIDTSSSVRGSAMGQTLSSRLEFAGWSRSNFAEKVGVTLEAVRQWCSGKAKPTQNHIDKIAETLNISVKETRSLLPRKRRSGSKGVKVRSRPAYKIAWTGANSFSARTENGSAQFTASKTGPKKREVWKIDKITDCNSPELASRLESDSNRGKIGRVLNMVRVNAKKKRKTKV